MLILFEMGRNQYLRCVNRMKSVISHELSFDNFGPFAHIKVSLGRTTDVILQPAHNTGHTSFLVLMRFNSKENDDI